MAAQNAAPALTAGQAVASAFGHQERVAQMMEALVAVRPILSGLQHEADFQMTRALALVDSALNASPVTQVRYGRWMICFAPPPIPTRKCDWQFVHDDYDGAPDAHDNRAGHAGSIAQAMAEIDEREGR